MSTKSGVQTNIFHIKKELSNRVEQAIESSKLINAATTLYSGGQINEELAIKINKRNNSELYELLQEIKYLTSELPEPKQ